MKPSFPNYQLQKVFFTLHASESDKMNAENEM